MQIRAIMSDITKLSDVDAIVNAANRSLLGAAESTGRSIAPQGPCWSRNVRRSGDARRGARRSRKGTIFRADT